jgi:hypothetical protein
MDFSKSASHASRAIALSAIIICFFFSTSHWQPERLHDDE